VRHADDCNIDVRSRRAGERAMTSVTGFVTKRPELQVKAAESAATPRSLLRGDPEGGPTVAAQIPGLQLHGRQGAAPVGLWRHPGIARGGATGDGASRHRR